MRELPLAFVMPKHGCVEESHKDVVLGGKDTKTAKQFSRLITFSSLLVQNVAPCHRAIPEASAVHQQLLAPAASPSICKVIASNQGPQQTNPDRYSHLRFTLGQLWCHPKGGCGGGERESQQSV